MGALNLRASVIACTSCLVLLAGCTRARLTPFDTATAESYVDLLRAHRFDQIENDMGPDQQNSDTRDSLAAMSSMFPSDQPVSVKVVGANTLSAPGFQSTDLSLEYHFPGQWLLADVTLQDANGTRSLTGFHVTPIPDSLEDTNRFSLFGKTELEYDILFLGILSILFSLYAFVVCLNTTLRRGKWFWLMLTLVGIGGFGVNWTTGQYAVTPLVLRLPPAGGSAPVYGPCMVYVAIPIGALIFLAVRKRLSSAPASEPQREHYGAIPKWLP